MAPSEDERVAEVVANFDSVALMPLADPVVEALGHEATSDYAEHFWLPLLGPDAFSAFRWMTRRLTELRSPVQVDLRTLAGELGLAERLESTAPLPRALGKLVAFRLIDVSGQRIVLRSKLPPLGRHQVDLLPGKLAEVHRRLEEHGWRTATSR